MDVLQDVQSVSAELLALVPQTLNEAESPRSFY